MSINSFEFSRRKAEQFHEIDRINFLHEAISFAKGGDDFLIVQDVVEIQTAATPVFEPFLRGLVTADAELPGQLGDRIKVVLVVDPDPTDFLRRIAEFIVLSADAADHIHSYLAGHPELFLSVSSFHEVLECKFYQMRYE